MKENRRKKQTNELNRTCTFKCDLMQQTTNNTRVHSSILASFFRVESERLECLNLRKFGKDFIFLENSASNDPTNSR